MISSVNSWLTKRTGLHNNLTTETLSDWQHNKLIDLVSYAGKNTRFYREKLSPVDNITELPFTYPSDIVNDPLAFLAIPQSEVERITTLTTSGTTGKKKRIFFSDSDLERTKDYFAEGMKTLMKEGQDAMILISDDTLNSLGSLLKSAIERIGCSAGITCNIENAGYAIEASRNRDCLIGMPAELLYMSRIEPALRPKSILLTADFIPVSVIKSLSDTWKCRVFSHYGLTEIGFGYAVDCEYHNGHHLRDADIIAEIIDPETGKPAAPGQAGELVLTALSNEAMPLIRYRTGDKSHMINEQCGCGSTLSRLGRIEGRYENDIPVYGNKTISIHQLDETLFAIPGIRSFDASLKNEEERRILHLDIDAGKGIDTELIRSNLPFDSGIKINLCKKDPFTHRGKRNINII